MPQRSEGEPNVPDESMQRDELAEPIGLTALEAAAGSEDLSASAPHYFARGLHDLRVARDTTAQELRAQGQDVPRRRVREAVAYLKANSLPMTSAAYKAIEQGQSFPRYGAAFLDAMGSFLELDPAQSDSLRTRLAYDIIYERLGRLVSISIPGDPKEKGWEPLVRDEE